MVEYIEKQKAVETVLALAKSSAEIGASESCLLALACAAVRVDDIVPIADVVEVVHGRWIKQDETFLNFQCSACGVKNHHTQWDYCPCCGAKMGGD